MTVASFELSTSIVSQKSSSINSRIFWINGSTGTGKTTIAYTMAISWHAKRILGASFFCSRDDATCSNPKLIFPSVAYQLGQFNSRFRDEVSQVVKSNPEIGYSSLSNQLERLIVNPSKYSANHSLPAWLSSMLSMSVKISAPHPKCWLFSLSTSKNLHRFAFYSPVGQRRKSHLISNRARSRQRRENLFYTKFGLVSYEMTLRNT